MNSALWPGAFSSSLQRLVGGRGYGGLERSPTLYPQSIFFYLWTSALLTVMIQYLSSYLNCIFKDFIQYLHAIRYESILFFANYCLFCFVFFLFNCQFLAWFVAIFKKTNKQMSPLDLFLVENCMGTFPVCFCVSFFRWQLIATEQVLPGDLQRPLLPGGVTGPKWWQVVSTFWLRESCWATIFSVSCPSLSFLCNRMSLCPKLILICCNNLSLKKHIIGNNTRVGLSSFAYIKVNFTV